MELNIYGNPLITLAFIHHDDTNDDRIRQRAWEDLTYFINETPEAINTIILGGLNTNIHARKDGEEGHIGPHINGRGMDFPRNKEHNTPANKTANREYMINHLGATDMKIANTYYQKSNKFKGTYQRKDNIDGGPPWSTDRYICIASWTIAWYVRRQWMNPVIDVQADPYTNINIDRKPVETRIRQ